MGFFYNYQSSGPGISKYGPKKKGLALFFDLFFRKFWKLCGLNLLFFIFCLPPIIAVALIRVIKDTRILLAVIIVLLLAFAVLIGPATAGMTKVIRAFIIEKHTFVIRDFFKGFKQNFKKACVIGLLDVLAALSAFSAYNIYPDWAEFYHNKLFYIPLTITLSVALVIMAMNYYIFLMLTATDLSLKNLIKNSFALAFVSLGKNILITLILIFFAVFMAILFLYATPFFFVVIPFFPAALVWFITCFNSYPVIQKYVINPFYESQGKINPEFTEAGDDIDEETLFEDMGGKEKPIDKRKKGKGKRIS